MHTKRTRWSTIFLEITNKRANFYDTLNEWYHQARQEMKHVSISTTNNVEFPINSSPNVESTPTLATMSTPTKKSYTEL